MGHIYDKLINCKTVMDVIESHFNFSLIGMEGNDIVNQHPKFIKTLLWQINLYHSTKSIQGINDDDTIITDKEMLAWANERIRLYQQIDHANEQYLLIKNEITSLSDSSLSDSIFFLNLIASVNAQWVNYELIH